MTTLTDGAEQECEILKVDCLGRVQTPPERREALLDEYERSGMSGKGFADHYGIKYQTFYSWRCQRRKDRRKAKGNQAKKKKDRSASSPSVTLAVAELPALPQAARSPSVALEVELPGSVRLSVNNSAGAHLAAELIRALGREPGRSC